MYAMRLGMSGEAAFGFCGVKIDAYEWPRDSDAESIIQLG